MTVCRPHMAGEGGGPLGGPRAGLTGWAAPQRIQLQWLLERGESKQFPGPHRPTKKYEKKITENSQVVLNYGNASQGGCRGSRGNPKWKILDSGVLQEKSAGLVD